MSAKIDFNCDMGESFGMYKMGFDEEVIKHITSDNLPGAWRDDRFRPHDSQPQGNGIMLLVALGFIYLAVSRELEPYELLPIGLGIIIANLPLTGLTDFITGSSSFQESGIFGIVFHYGLSFWNLPDSWKVLPKTSNPYFFYFES